MSDAALHHPAGTLTSGNDTVSLTPDQAGWSYVGLRVAALTAGASLSFRTDKIEAAVVPLAGSASVTIDGDTFQLAGRDHVFHRVTDWAYVPVGCEVTVTSEHGAELAVASARAEERFDAAHVAARDVPIEIRGSGSATRQVVNFMSPECFANAHRLICVEVLTPDGNWSSYPPHKHDDSPGSLVENEEIYYFRIGRTTSPGTSREGFALHRTYTADGTIDATTPVRDGDIFLVPRGYHGPTVAAPGYPLYYLNVMAGPGAARSMAITDDPQHAWIRDAWNDAPADPRCPMIEAA
jgi:5-deoxy-glucuronate isomerase